VGLEDVPSAATNERTTGTAHALGDEITERAMVRWDLRARRQVLRIPAEDVTPMGTKANPGKYDCLDKAEQDEPFFVLLARDPLAPLLVDRWAKWAEELGEDPEKVAEARENALAMLAWHRANIDSAKRGDP
jgi:hypothetical protein